MTINNPNRTAVAQGQGAAIFADINDNLDQIEQSLTGVVSLTLAASPRTLTAAEFWADAFFRLTSASPSPSGAFLLHVPANVRGMFYIENRSGANVSVGISGQASERPIILNSNDGLLYSDGTNVRPVGFLHARLSAAQYAALTPQAFTIYYVV